MTGEGRGSGEKGYRESSLSQSEGSREGISKKKKNLLDYLAELGITDEKEAKEIFGTLKLETLLYQIGSVRLLAKKLAGQNKKLDK